MGSFATFLAAMLTVPTGIETSVESRIQTKGH